MGRTWLAGASGTLFALGLLTACSADDTIALDDAGGDAADATVADGSSGDVGVDGSMLLDAGGSGDGGDATADAGLVQCGSDAGYLYLDGSWLDTCGFNGSGGYDEAGVCHLGAGAPFACPRGRPCIIDNPTSAVACSDGPCTVLCTGGGSCAGNVDCSKAASCTVLCTGGGSCAGNIDCSSAGSCVVGCTGGSSCKGSIDCSKSADCRVKCGDGNGGSLCAGEIACGPGRCDVACYSGGNCGWGTDGGKYVVLQQPDGAAFPQINCSNSAACNVTCSSANECNGGVACPPGCAADSGLGCATTGPGCDRCSK